MLQKHILEILFDKLHRTCVCNLFLLESSVAVASLVAKRENAQCCSPGLSQAHRMISANLIPSSQCLFPPVQLLRLGEALSCKYSEAYKKEKGRKFKW